MRRYGNQRWPLDFVSDAFADDRRFRILYVIDDFSRECLATVVDTSLSGHRVARELDRIAEMRGYPCMVASDNGTELTSNAMLKWQEEWHYIAPGKPMQNGFVEVLAYPMRFSPDQRQIDGARHPYEDWWRSPGWVRDGLIEGGTLQEVEGMPKRRPCS